LHPQRTRSSCARSGEVIGQDYLAGNHACRPFFWNGRRLIDLGTFGGDQGAASYINNAGVVGGETCTHNDALIWVHGHQYDLNTLVPPTGIHLTDSESINDRGEIVALGQLPNGDQHIFVLTPDTRQLHASVAAKRQTATTNVQHGSLRPGVWRATNVPRARWWQLGRAARLRNPTLVGVPAANPR
jgi:hypothetical protein